MAVLGRVLISGAERLDLPDLLSIDSFTAGDFKYLLRGLVGDDKPYVLKGFEIINPGDAIGGQTLSIKVADSVVFYPGSTAGPFFYGLEEGDSRSQPLVPELRKSATNFIYLTLSTFDAAQDTRAFWDPDKEGGIGGEFTQDVNTESVLRVDVNVSVSAFPENTIPIAKVKVGTNFIESIEDTRDLLFRLGAGGLTPNPFQKFNFRSEPALGYERTEPNTFMNSALNPDPFAGGDKNIRTLKEWMDAIMTKIAELGGTTFWYEDASSYNLVNLFIDALATSIKSKGRWEVSESTVGQVTWTEDLHIRIMHDPRTIYIRAGQKVLENDEVLYIERERNAPFNVGNLQVDWFENLTYVNGLLGAFEDLSIGDWVKKQDDPDTYYRRVEAFFSANNLGGGITTADNARSIRLSEPYPGISESRAGGYEKGEYQLVDVKVAPRTDVDLNDIGGNLFWMATRSDHELSIGDITTTVLTMDLTESDGKTVKCTCNAVHDLEDGERVFLAGTYTGEYKVEVESPTIFYIQIEGTAHDGVTSDDLGINGYYATVTTVSRSTSVGYLDESANHGLLEDEQIFIEDTSTAYDDEYKVFPKSAITYTVPVTSALPNITTGITRQVRVNIRTDLGATKLLPGEIKYVGEVDTSIMRDFIGQESPTQTRPNYRIPPSYNTMDGQENYNGDVDDDLTVRVSKLTAMMADKAQDKTIIFAGSGFSGITNVHESIPDESTLRFVYLAAATPPSLSILLPNSHARQTVLGLTGSITLNAREAAYILIDRNDQLIYPDLSSVTIADIEDVPLDENVFIIAIRFDDESCYLWDGTELDVGYTLTHDTISDILNANTYDEEMLIIDTPPANTFEYQAIDDFTEPNLIGVIEKTVQDGRIIPLPENTRNLGTPQDYRIGSGALEVSLNGQVLTPLKDWEEEVAGPGNLSPTIGLNDFEAVHLGTTITIHRRLHLGDTLRFRLASAGGHAGPSSGGGGGGGGGGEANALINAGTVADGQPLANAKVGVNLIVKRLKEGPGVTIAVDPSNNALVISASSAGEANDATNLGTAPDGEGLFTSKVGTLLPFKRIKAGTNIAFNVSGNFVEINATGTGEVNDLFNYGSAPDGEALVSAKLGTNYFVKRVKGSDSITVTSNTNSVILSVSPDADAKAIVKTYLNNTVSLIPAFTPVCIAADGNIQPIDVADATDSETFVGITTESIAPAASGKVCLGGVIKNVTGVSVRDLLFISKTGGLTTTKPSVGVGGFVVGDHILKVGVVAKNQDVPANTDLIVMPRVVGQL